MDQELSAKVEGELQIEKEVKDGKQLPSNLQEYLDNAPFKVFSTERSYPSKLIPASYTIAQVMKKSA